MDGSFSDTRERSPFARALDAAARELEAQHTTCQAIDRALGRFGADDDVGGLEDYDVIQLLDRHTQIIADISRFLATLSDATADPDVIDVSPAYAAIKLDSLRSRLRHGESKGIAPEEEQIELF